MTVQAGFLFCRETLFRSMLTASDSVLKYNSGKAFGLEKRVNISEEMPSCG